MPHVDGIVSPAKTSNHLSYADALGRECARLNAVLEALPELLCSPSPITIRDFEERCGMSKIEVLLGGWEKVIDTINEAIRVKNENLLLTKQFDSLREAIYNAVEGAVRPLRDSRVNDLLLDSDTPV